MCKNCTYQQNNTYDERKNCDSASVKGKLTTERSKNLRTNIKETPTSRTINTERDSSHTFRMNFHDFCHVE